MKVLLLFVLLNLLISSLSVSQCCENCVQTVLEQEDLSVQDNKEWSCQNTKVCAIPCKLIPTFRNCKKAAFFKLTSSDQLNTYERVCVTKRRNAAAQMIEILKKKFLNQIKQEYSSDPIIIGTIREILNMFFIKVTQLCENHPKGENDKYLKALEDSIRKNDPFLKKLPPNFWATKFYFRFNILMFQFNEYTDVGSMALIFTKTLKKSWLERCDCTLFHTNIWQEIEVSRTAIAFCQRIC